MAAQEQVVPKIVLIPHARSHPFAQRECILEEPLKVGRPVDKKKISQNNLIFDCRVLSRNHALIWFEKGKFFIRDTKSSNGTFVNECRLSPSGEESPPSEIKTRDIIQFGVNVNVEKKVTHGCIIATVKLFINDKELPGPDPDIQQVMQIVQNALSREQEVENKLASMQEVLTTAHALAKDNMISIVKEDELLSRLEMLENQLQVYSRNISEDELRKQLTKTLEEKHKTEKTSKETVRNLLQEKIDSTAKLSQLQRDYDKAEEECQRYRTLYEALKQDHSQQVSKLSEQVKLLEKEKTDLEGKNMDELNQLASSKESLQVELDAARSELDSTKLRLKERDDELSQSKIELDLLHKRDKLTAVKIRDNEEPGTMHMIRDDVMVNALSGETETETETVYRHGNQSVENGEFDERRIQEPDIEMTITSTLYSNPKTSNDFSEQLKMSEDKVEQLSVEISSLKKLHDTMQQQIEELKGQLELSSKEKLLLEQELETKSKTLTDMTTPLEQQRKELEKLRGEVLVNRQYTTSDVTDLPTDLEQCQAQLLEMRRLSEQLNQALIQRDDEIVSIKEERKKLEIKLLTLQSDHSSVTEENRRKQNNLQAELTEVQIEAKSLTEQLHQLQETLAETKANSTPSASSSEVSLLETPPPHFDPRLKVLSVITLVSIAIAIISATFAYFF